MIHKTQIQKVRTEMKKNRALINEKINRTESDTFWLIIDSGQSFLAKVYGYQTAPYIKHSRSKAFWSWYRLQWYGVEKSFVHHIKKHSSRVPESMIRNQYHHFLNFFCLESNRIDEAFKNYLKNAR